MIAHAFRTMGTVVSLMSASPLGTPAIGRVEEVFRGYDERFSLYRPDSELSRIADGRLRLGAASEQTRDAYAEALRWSGRTLGAFTPHRPDGVLDLAGTVKALAIRDAGAALDAAGALDWVVNAGGDSLERRPADLPPRAVGIADPDRRGRILTAITLSGRRRAVATSGTSERGEHVWGRAPGIRQATVVADDIVTADVYATAILAAGTDLLDALTATADLDALLLRDDGEMLATGGIRLAA